MAGFKPLSNRVLVERAESEEKVGSIIIPDAAKEKPAMGSIFEVGPGERDEKGELRPMSVKKGDRVLFGKYAGNEIVLEGKTYVILREDEILGIFT